MLLEIKNRTVVDVFVKKAILCVTGTILIGLGAAMYLKSRLGSDPISVWLDGLHATFNLSFGKASLINSSITLLLAVIVARRYIYMGTVIGALLTGPMIEFFDPYIDIVFTVNPSLSLKLSMILIGQIVLCVGVAFVLSARFGFGTVDCIIFRICDKTNWKYKYLKIFMDTSYTVIGFLLGGVFGIGTILGVITGGPLISGITRLLDRTILKKLGLYDEKNEFKKTKVKNAARVSPLINNDKI